MYVLHSPCNQILYSWMAEDISYMSVSTDKMKLGAQKNMWQRQRRWDSIGIVYRTHTITLALFCFLSSESWENTEHSKRSRIWICDGTNPYRCRVTKTKAKKMTKKTQQTPVRANMTITHINNEQREGKQGSWNSSSLRKYNNIV